MRYLFKCESIDCENRNKELIIEKPMSESGTEEICQECKNPLTRIYGSAIKPAGDKNKY
jgi:hypothetical protein